MEIRLDYSKKLVYGINRKIPSCLIEVNISILILLVVRDLVKSYHLSVCQLGENSSSLNEYLEKSCLITYPDYLCD